MFVSGSFEALQRAGFAWATDPQRLAVGFTHLKIRPKDMARFGQLFLQQGRWDGKHVVPPKWVREATTAQAGDAYSKYGYMWWLTTTDHTAAYFAGGLGGQLIEVIPHRQLVVVISTYVNLATYQPLVTDQDRAGLATAIVRAVAPSAKN